MSDTSAPVRSPTLLLVTADLFLGSRLKGIAESSGFRVVSMPRLGADAELTAECALLDLASPGIDVVAAIDRFGADAPNRVAAYAPHVRVDLLRAARAAGLKAVFTRGQLESELPRWLAGH